jgi:glycosyltransferase involved in cell wall biosynthesis
MTIDVRTEIPAQTDGEGPKPSAALATVVSVPESIAFVDLAVVIPAFNEQNGIQQGIEELNRTLSQLDLSYEIVVVNDGSTDRTREKAEEAGVRVINQRENRGYGAALKKGIASSNSTYIAIIDADGTYPASAIPEMLRLAATAEMVVGDRGAAMKNVPALRKPAKKMLNSLANYLAGRKINDLNSGLRVFRRRSLESFVPLLPDGFSFTTTITLCMVCSGLDVVYTPIAYGARVGESKIRAKHFFAFILLVLRAVMLFNPLRVFLPMGAVFVTLGVAKFAYDIYKWNLSESAVLAILGGLGAWALGLIADMISRIHLRP